MAVNKDEYKQNPHTGKPDNIGPLASTENDGRITKEDKAKVDAGGDYSYMGVVYDAARQHSWANTFDTGNDWDKTTDRIEAEMLWLYRAGVRSISLTVGPKNYIGAAYTQMPGTAPLNPQESDEWEAVDTIIKMCRRLGMTVALQIIKPTPGAGNAAANLEANGNYTIQDAIDYWFKPFWEFVADRYKDDTDVLEPVIVAHEMLGNFNAFGNVQYTDAVYESNPLNEGWGDPDPAWIKYTYDIAKIIKDTAPNIKTALTLPIYPGFYTSAYGRTPDEYWAIIADTIRNYDAGYGPGWADAGHTQKWIDIFDTYIDTEYPDASSIANLEAEFTPMVDNLFNLKTGMKFRVYEWGYFADTRGTVNLTNGSPTITQYYVMDFTTASADYDPVTAGDEIQVPGQVEIYTVQSVSPTEITLTENYTGPTLSQVMINNVTHQKNAVERMQNLRDYIDSHRNQFGMSYMYELHSSNRPKIIGSDGTPYPYYDSSIGAGIWSNPGRGLLAEDTRTETALGAAFRANGTKKNGVNIPARLPMAATQNVPDALPDGDVVVDRDTGEMWIGKGTDPLLSVARYHSGEFTGGSGFIGGFENIADAVNGVPFVIRKSRQYGPALAGDFGGNVRYQFYLGSDYKSTAEIATQLIDATNGATSLYFSNVDQDTGILRPSLVMDEQQNVHISPTVPTVLASGNGAAYNLLLDSLASSAPSTGISDKVALYGADAGAAGTTGLFIKTENNQTFKFGTDTTYGTGVYINGTKMPSQVSGTTGSVQLNDGNFGLTSNTELKFTANQLRTPDLVLTDTAPTLFTNSYSTTGLRTAPTSTIFAGLSDRIPLITQNYIPKAGATAYGASQIYDSGTAVGVNTASPISLIDAYSTSANPTLTVRDEVTSATGGGVINLRHSNASDTYASSGDVLGSLQGGSRSGGTNRNAARIRFIADENITASTAAGSIGFDTTPTGSTTPTRKMTINGAGLTTNANGGGVPFGHMYVNDIAGFTITVGAANTWYEIDNGSSPTFTSGLLKNVTFTDHYLTAVTAGYYQVDYSVSIDTTSAGDEIAATVAVNGTASVTAHSHGTVAAGNSATEVSGVTILNLAANDQVSIVVENHSAARDVIVHHAQLRIIYIGSP